MKKFLKMSCNKSINSSRFMRIMLLLLMAWGNIITQAQTIGIIQGLTLVTPTVGPPQPSTGAPTVQFPVVMGGPGELYVNRFYTFNNSGQLVELMGVPVNYDPIGFTGWFGYCVLCIPGDIPPLYRVITLNCLTGSVYPWIPDPWADPAHDVQTNPCTNSNAWSNPLTWSEYKVPTQFTGAFNINRDVQLDVDFVIENKSITCSNNSAVIISSGVTFTSINTNIGRFVNNGVITGIGPLANLVNNAVVSPGVNGIGQFAVRYGTYIQNASGSLNIQLESTSSFDNLYCYQNSADNVLGGTLKVSLLNGFMPVRNNQFKIIETAYGSTYTGTFSNLDMPALPNGLKWQVSYNPTDVRLTIVDSSILGGAFNFGTGTYATIPTNNFPVGNSNYTIESWVKSSVDRYNAVMQWGSRNINAANGFQLVPGNKIMNYWWGNELVVDAPTVNDGNWHHIAATFDGTIRKIYMDGILLGSDNPTGHNTSPGSTGFLGGSDYQSPFVGALDEVRVFTRALTQAEINSTMNCEIPANTPGLSAYFKFNQGLAYQNNNIVTSFTDASPNGNTSNLWAGYALVDMVNNFVEGAVANGQTCGSCTGAPSNPAVTGQANVCSYINTGTPVTYTATSPGATSFTWTLPPNVTLLSGAGTGTIVVTFNNGYAAQANKQLRVTATSACGTSPLSIFYTAAQFPTTPGSITGPTDICALIGTTTTATYKINKVAAASSYAWTVPAGFSSVVHPGTGVNDTSIVVTFSNSFVSSSITVSAVNDCGTSGGVRSFYIPRIPASTPGLISGPTNVCAFIAPNGGPATYSVYATAGTTYTWAPPAGSTGLTGQGTNTISFTYPAGFTGGTISVTASNGCGPSAGTRTLVVSKLNPGTPSAIDVVVAVACPNRVYTYSLSAMPANATSVLWTVPVGATITAGLGTFSITVSYPGTAITGNVTAQAINNCNVSTIRSVKVKLPACPVEPPPTTFAKGTVQPTVSESLAVNVYPNPTVNDFKLQVLTAGKESIKVRVLDMAGRFLKQVIVMPYQTISIGNELKAGSYMITVSQGGEMKTVRVVKF